MHKHDVPRFPSKEYKNEFWSEGTNGFAAATLYFTCFASAALALPMQLRDSWTP